MRDTDTGATVAKADNRALIFGVTMLIIGIIGLFAS